MKKNLILISLLCFSAAVMAQGKKEDVKGAHPYKVDENEEVVPEFSHWSLTPHVGFNYFDGDFHSEMKHAIAIPNAGLDVEYSFNPVWGLGVNYMYDMYTVTGKQGEGLFNADTLLNGHMHKAGLYVSMDFMNLFCPKATKKIFSANAIVGGGYAWYKTTTMFHDDYWEDERPRRERYSHSRRDGDFGGRKDDFGGRKDDFGGRRDDFGGRSGSRGFTGNARTDLGKPGKSRSKDGRNTPKRSDRSSKNHGKGGKGGSWYDF